MLNNEQYDVLKLITMFETTSPIGAIEIINHANSDNKPHFLEAHKYIQDLYNLGYLKPYNQLVPYRDGYLGPITATIAGRLAISDYENNQIQTKSQQIIEKKNRNRFVITTIIGIITIVVSVVFS